MNSGMDALDGRFRNLLEEVIGPEKAAVAFSALCSPASVSVRYNPFKTAEEDRAGDAHVPWSPYGMFLDGRPLFTADPLFHAGAYYVQDSSAMFVGHVFRNVLRRYAGRRERPVRVLDLCAAPGGKTTDVAASLREICGSSYVLVSNEVMKQRVTVLASNAAVWGDPCVVVTSDDPAVIGRLEGWFDIIIADVPCSGEGMFRKDSSAVEQWSEDNVKLCQGRQRRILADVWPALAEGGTLIYSTCTFNRYENDDNVRWMGDVLGAEILSHEEICGETVPEGIVMTGNGFSLVPGLVRGEGQYCSAVVRTGGMQGDGIRCLRTRQRHSARGAGTTVRTALRADEVFSIPVVLSSRGELLKAVPAEIDAEVKFIEDNLHVIMSGCAVGEMVKGQLVPDPDLALSCFFRQEMFQSVSLERPDALSFLQGNQIVLPGCRTGYVTVCYGAHPMGFVKNIGNRCNNLYPKQRRIKMDLRNL